jgi:hypothetical protein
MLSSIVIPVIQNYAYVWQLYSGGSLAWPDTYSWQVAIADPLWSKVLVSILSITLLCSLGLLFLLPRQETGLADNPLGIASLQELILKKRWTDLQFDEHAYEQKLSELLSQLGSVWYHLISDGEHLRLEPTTAPPRHKISIILGKYIPFMKAIQRAKQALKPTFAILGRYVAIVKSWIIDYPNFFLFRQYIFVIWLGFLLLLSIFGIYISTIMKSNARAGLLNFVMPLSPNLYLIVGVFVQVFIPH